MIYFVSNLENLYYMKELSKAFKTELLQEKDVDLKRINRKDIVVSNNQQLCANAKKRGAISIFLLSNGIFEKDITDSFDISFWYGSHRFKKTSINGIKAFINFKRGALKPKIRYGIVNIVLNKNTHKILLLKNRSPNWGYGIIQGGIEEGESRLDALKRETYEESGIDVFEIIEDRGMQKPFYIVSFKKDGTVNNISIMRYVLFITMVDKVVNITFNDHTAKKAFVSGGWYDIHHAKNMLQRQRHLEYLKAVEYKY